MPKNTTTIGFGSPSRYFQGHGQLNKLESYSIGFGTNVLALIDPFFFPEMTARLEGLYAAGASTSKITGSNFNVTVIREY